MGKPFNVDGCFMPPDVSVCLESKAAPQPVQIQNEHSTIAYWVCLVHWLGQVNMSICLQ